MNPPAAIDTLFNRIARREVLLPGPVVDFDTALPPFEVQAEARFLRKTIFRFLAPTASSNFPPLLGYSILRHGAFGKCSRGFCGSLRNYGRSQRQRETRPNASENSRSGPRPAFELLEGLVAVHTSRLCCGKVGNTQIFTPDRESSGESRLYGSHPA